MNTTGRLFRVGITGSSRGTGVAAWIEGCPPGLNIDPAMLEAQLAKRRPGTPGTTARREPDHPRIVSGVYQGRSTGQPILILIDNRDALDDGQDPGRVPRPGHADLVAKQRYGGFADPRGGGAFSGRLTAALVAAGAVARCLLPGVSLEATLLEAGGRADVDAAVADALADHDSIGGLIRCTIHGVPTGWGEPLLDPLDARLAQLCLCIPGVRSFGIGAGRGMASMRGSQANDAILDPSGRTASNHAGGVNGGLSNGNPVVFEIVARPTPSIAKAQRSVDLHTGEPTTVASAGRHDACFALRLPPIVEAAAAIVLADFALLARAQGPYSTLDAT
jgi:chorismate synthase